MIRSCSEIYEFIRMVFAGNYYGLFYLASLLYLAAAEPGWRRRVVFPTLFTVLVLLNPVSYHFFWKHISYSNWRLLWMLPVVGTIGLAAVCAAGRFVRPYQRALAGLGLLLLLLLGGSSVYSFPGTAFSESTNLYKLPEEAVAAARLLLQQEEHPRTVASSGVFCYLRQYSADIELMYGRDVFGYIHRIDEDRKAVYELLDEEEPDFGRVFSEMERLDYTYLILWDGGKFSEPEMNKSGFFKLGEAGQYSVYRRGRENAEEQSG